MHPRTLCSAHNLCNILREQAWFKLFKWESDVFVLITAFALYIYMIFVSSSWNSKRCSTSKNTIICAHTHTCNVNVTSGKRETEAKFKSNLFRAFFGTYFWSRFHLSWFTTAARVTLKKPPSCCQRQWHHCKRWGLCRIVVFVLLPTLISKSRLKFFFSGSCESQDDCYGFVYRSRVLWHPFLQVCGKDHPRTLVAVAGPNVPQRRVGGLLWGLLCHLSAHLKVSGFISSPGISNIFPSTHIIWFLWSHHLLLILPDTSQRWWVLCLLKVFELGFFCWEMRDIRMFMENPEMQRCL